LDRCHAPLAIAIPAFAKRSPFCDGSPIDLQQPRKIGLSRYSRNESRPLNVIVTTLTEMFGLRHPIVLGPMGGVSGGHLAAAVSNTGGLGLVGGG
jgi:hypothetical protein